MDDAHARLDRQASDFITGEMESALRNSLSSGYGLLDDSAVTVSAAEGKAIFDDRPLTVQVRHFYDEYDP